MSDSHTSFRARIRDRFREQPYPLFCFSEGVIPAASVWTGSRLWVEAFRTLGLAPGDRLLLALPPSAAWLQVFIAAIWEGLTLAFVPSTTEPIALSRHMERVDARLTVCFSSASDDSVELPDGFLIADRWSGPESLPQRLRKTRFVPSKEIRFLLRTSGTESGEGRWIALSDTNILAVVQSHLPLLGLVEEESRVLSVLPWSHAFGLIIDLLPAIFSGAEIHRDASGGRDIPALLEMSSSEGITHLSAVPLTLKRIMGTAQGKVFLQSLKGGVIGGAPIGDTLTEFVRETRLRVGYGQTEASPGITLGDPGVFPKARYLGRPLNCQIKQGGSRTLLFAGANACAGTWSEETGLTLLDPNRWQDTGDLVVLDDGNLFYEGRADSAFKLANGRRIEAEPLENVIRAAIPGIENVFLFSRDEECLEVAADLPLNPAIVTKVLGTAGRLFRRGLQVPTEAFVFTPKGTLNRAATRQNILRLVET